MSKIVTINKWGNSLAVRIPQFIVDNLELEKGDMAELSYQGNRIILELHKEEKSAKLKTPAEAFDEMILRQLKEQGVPGFV